MFPAGSAMDRGKNREMKMRHGTGFPPPSRERAFVNVADWIA